MVNGGDVLVRGGYDAADNDAALGTADEQFACEHATVMIVTRKAHRLPVFYAGPVAALVAIVLLAMGL